MVFKTNKKLKTQRFKTIERKASISFFWCFVITVIAFAIINSKQSLPAVITVCATTMLVIISSVIGLRFFFKRYYRQGWHVLLLKQLSKINKPAIWITFGLIFLVVYTYKPSFAAHRIQLLSPQRDAIESIASGWFISPAFVLTFPKIPSDGSQKQIGYYGWGVTGGYQFSPYPQHMLGLQLSYRHNSKTSFITSWHHLATQSLHDVSLLTQYQYTPCACLSQWHIGLSGGLGFVFGFNEGDNISVRFYRNIATIAGINTGLLLTHKLSVEMDYFHYCTPFQSTTANQSKSTIPTMNRLLLGVRYVF